MRKPSEELIRPRLVLCLTRLDELFQHLDLVVGLKIALPCGQFMACLFEVESHGLYLVLQSLDLFHFLGERLDGCVKFLHARVAEETRGDELE